MTTFSEAASNMGGLSLSGLPKLLKTHYSWPLYDNGPSGNYYDLSDDNFLQYVRILGSCPFRLDNIFENENQLVSCVTACKLYNASIGITYSPFLDYYFNAGQCSAGGLNSGKCPPPEQTDIDSEVGNINSYLSKVRSVLDRENLSQQTCAEVSAIFYDQEVWGSSTSSPSVVIAALTAVYDAALPFFPFADVSWYNRDTWAAYPFCDIEKPSCWVNDGSAVLEKGHNVGTSMYFPGCEATMSALWERNGVQADSSASTDGLSMELTPYISLGSGWGEMNDGGGCTGNFAVWNWTWEYETSLSWGYGANVNSFAADSPWVTIQANVRPYLYPPPLNERSEFVENDVLGPTRNSWLHFAAYVMGAHGLTVFPTAPVARTSSIPACSKLPAPQTPTSDKSTFPLAAVFWIAGGVIALGLASALIAARCRGLVRDKDLKLGIENVQKDGMAMESALTKKLLQPEMIEES